MHRATFGKRMITQASLATLARPDASEDAARLVQDVLKSSDAATGKSRTPAALEHVAWSYFKACVIAFVTAVMLMGFAHGVSDPMSPFFARLHYYYAGGALMLTLAPAIAQPIRYLADAAQRQGIPRGWSDVLIGGVCGGFPMLGQLAAGMKPDSITICFLFGGLFGGFYFWRRRGYPGLASDHLGVVEQIYRIVRRLRGKLTA